MEDRHRQQHHHQHQQQQQQQHQQLQQQQQRQQAHQARTNFPGMSRQNPQLFFSRTVSRTTTALPGNIPPLMSMAPRTPIPPLAPIAAMTPRTPITPPGSSSKTIAVVPQLQNVVSTVNLGCKLELKIIARTGRNVEYNPRRFAALTMRMRKPRTTALIFSSGKIVCTGAMSEEESRFAARRYARMVQKLGFPVKFLDFKIQNIVGSCEMKFPIQLDGLSHAKQQTCSYEPELFPGLIYRMTEPKIVLLIFASGKVVLTGAKTRREIDEAFETICPLLKNFQKTS